MSDSDNWREYFEMELWAETRLKKSNQIDDNDDDSFFFVLPMWPTLQRTSRRRRPRPTRYRRIKQQCRRRDEGDEATVAPKTEPVGGDNISDRDVQSAGQNVQIIISHGVCSIREDSLELTSCWNTGDGDDDDAGDGNDNDNGNDDGDDDEGEKE